MGFWDFAKVLDNQNRCFYIHTSNCPWCAWNIYIYIYSSYNTLSLYVKFVGVYGLECDTIEKQQKRISWKGLLMRKCRLWSEAPGSDVFTMQVLQERWDILKMIFRRCLVNFLIESFNWCFNINSNVILGGVANGEDGIGAWICFRVVFYWPCYMFLRSSSFYFSFNCWIKH